MCSRRFSLKIKRTDLLRISLSGLMSVSLAQANNVLQKSKQLKIRFLTSVIFDC